MRYQSCVEVKQIRMADNCSGNADILELYGVGHKLGDT